VVAPPTEIVPVAILGMAYVSFGSMLLGFFAWYSGLALGGVARVGQLQLTQVFMTLGAAALFFGETVPPASWLFAVGVVGCVAAGRRATVAAPRREPAAGDVLLGGAPAEHPHLGAIPIAEPEPASGA
jgi:drug/metabolite transporter (DMT)-like permease